MIKSLSFDSPYDRELAIMEKTFELEIMKIEDEWLNESTDLFIENENKDKGEKRFNLLSGILNAISNLFSSFIHMIENMFNGKEHLTAEEYCNSPTGKMKLEMDIEKANEEIDKKILEGRTMIQKISQSTGISDQEVANFVDSCAKSLDDASPIIINEALAWNSRQKILKNMTKNKKFIDETNKGINRSDLNRLEDEHIGQIAKILDAMRGLASKQVSINTKFMKDLKSVGKE